MNNMKKGTTVLKKVFGLFSDSIFSLQYRYLINWKELGSNESASRGKSNVPVLIS